MCIRCDVSKFNQATSAFVSDLAESLVDAIGVIEHMKARGITLDADEKAVYEKVFQYAKGSEAQQPANNAAGFEGRETIPAEAQPFVEALRQAFPGAQVVVGTPEQIEAMLEKESKGEKPN